MLLPDFRAFAGFLFYADPGSGALLWQLIGSFFMGLLFYSRRLFRRIKSRDQR